MAELRKTYTVLVKAEYYATIEVEPDDELDTDQIEEAGVEAMYDEPHRLEIQDTRITDTFIECDACGEGGVEEEHECDEEEEGEENA